MCFGGQPDPPLNPEDTPLDQTEEDVKFQKNKSTPLDTERSLTQQGE